MTTTTLTFELRPEPALSDADRRRVAAWLAASLPSLRDLSREAACEAAAHLVSDVLAFGLLAGRETSDVMADVLSRAMRDGAAADAVVGAMESGELATSKALARAMQDILNEPGATAATAMQIFIEPLQPADQAYL